MRLICPNCGAQYEVDPQVIPDGGRDVQCSNCGHTWFQRPDDDEMSDDIGLSPEADIAATADLPDSDAPDISTDDDAEFEFAASAASDEELEDENDYQSDDQDDADILAEAFAEPAPEPEPEAEPEPEPAAEDEVEDEGPQRRGLDEDVLSILREEAERETSARQSEALESQPELGLEESQSSGSEKRGLRERMARLRGVEDAAIAGAAAAAAESGKRRDLLPDIEEINSTLRADDAGDEDDESPEAARRRRSGFALGFVPIVLIVALAILAYAFAPMLADAKPSLREPLTGYVDTMNGLRDWLDGAMARAIEKLTALLDQLNKKDS